MQKCVFVGLQDDESHLANVRHSCLVGFHAFLYWKLGVDEDV